MQTHTRRLATNISTQINLRPCLGLPAFLQHLDRFCHFRTERQLDSKRASHTPTVVTPAAGESILKPHIGCDAQSSVQVCRPVVLLMLLSQSIAFQWMRNPQNSPFPLVESTPPPNTWFIGPTRVFVSNRSGYPFFFGSPETMPVLCNEACAPKNCPSPRWTWTLGSHPVRGYLGQPESTTQTASRPVHPFLHGSCCDQLTHTQTHRQTDHGTCVARGRIFALYACDAAL